MNKTTSLLWSSLSDLKQAFMLNFSDFQTTISTQHKTKNWDPQVHLNALNVAFSLRSLPHKKRWQVRSLWCKSWVCLPQIPQCQV